MRPWLSILLVFTLLLAPVSGLSAAPTRQVSTAAEILRAMTPAERVGQLFLVGFYGASAADTTDIYRLITEYHVGGVALAAASDNITDTVQAPTQVLSLTNELQTAAVRVAEIPRQAPGPEGDLEPPPYVPLLVAINHEGNGFPGTEIQSGLTSVPSAMAIGATWDPTHAESMGRIVGTELAALGINMLLGPALDVLENPRPDGSDLGTRVFGGDPYWVGVMGQAYIRGVHFGAGNSVAVIAKHFPGIGGSDRRPDLELPTVRKSLQDLTSFDLVPFFQVMNGLPAQAAPGSGLADGVLGATIRFQGFQGDIRQVTPPVGLDPAAFGPLLQLPQVAAWRAGGGLTVSDSLGSLAVKQVYDVNETNFPNRRVAGEAFRAGNDLLLLTEFGVNPRVDQTSEIIDTLNYFQQQYATDPNFAAQVDAAVERILALKLRLYGGSFNPEAATRPVENLSVLRRDEEDVLVLAQDTAALVNPTLEELTGRAPAPPGVNDRVVFFTDVRQGQQCSTCLRTPQLTEFQLQDEVAARYGPNGTGQVRNSNLQSFTFEEMAEFLAQPTTPEVGDETPTPEPSPVQTALELADWIVFGMLNVAPDVPWSRAVSDFLAQRPDLYRNKRVVVLAFDAPYYLDQTDLSKVTAYYALYSHTPPFVTVAARLLFRDFTPQGAPPVSVAASGYKLADVTRPDPARSIELFWEKANATASEDPVVTLQQFDTITVTTGILLDHNGHQVPDGTPVTFRINYPEEGLLLDLRTAQTNGGMAATTVSLERVGMLEITASSDPALSSTQLRIPVQQDPFSVTEIVPTPMPTNTPEPTDTPVPPTATVTVTPTAVVTPAPPPPDIVDWRGFFVMCLGLAAALVGGYRLGNNGYTAQGRQGVRVALAGAIGLLLGYNYVALGLPGSASSFTALDVLAAPTWALIGGALGVLAGWYVFVLRRRN